MERVSRPDDRVLPLFKAALLAVVANWPPIWACAYAFKSNTVQIPRNLPEWR
jgi:hypothetical protein